MHGKWFSFLLLMTLLWIAPPGAKALALTVAGGSVDMAEGCTDLTCSLSPPTFELGLGGSASGTLGTDGTTIGIALTIDLWTLEAVGGAPDNGIDELELSDITYTASLPHTGTLSDFNGAGLGTAVGTLTQRNSGSVVVGPAALALNAGINVDCQETAPDVYKCGVVLAGLLFPIDVGDPAVTRYAPHTIDLTAVPEPATSVMGLTAGLLGLAYARRKRLSGSART